MTRLGAGASPVNNEAWGVIELFQDAEGADKVRVLSTGRSSCAAKLSAT